LYRVEPTLPKLHFIRIPISGANSPGPAQDSQALDHQGRPRKLGRPFHVTLALLKNEHCPENPTRIMCRGLAKQGIVKLPGYEPAPVVSIVAK